MVAPGTSSTGASTASCSWPRSRAASCRPALSARKPRRSATGYSRRPGDPRVARLPSLHRGIAPRSLRASLWSPGGPLTGGRGGLPARHVRRTAQEQLGSEVVPDSCRVCARYDRQRDQSDTRLRKQQVLGSSPSVGSIRSRVKAGLSACFFGLPPSRWWASPPAEVAPSRRRRRATSSCCPSSAETVRSCVAYLLSVTGDP
jgi:hypothetical protein